MKTEKNLLCTLTEICGETRYDSHDGTMTMDGNSGLTDLRKEREHNKWLCAYLTMLDKRVSDWVRE